ncbi:Transthyretin-like family protein [Ancylostoma caninum]|uniref:Transthyretin-like family protein n=1 Tax=Ancylostoma caninum TaxID=29170 RepID=A0A368FRA2_ANCCA|nr:Transthyretin-like family protein [Ancylostoma caninum]
MYSLIYLMFVLPCAFAQFPGMGLGAGGLQPGMYGGRLPGSPMNVYGSGRSYFVRGRLVCGIQGAQGARVSLWERRGGGAPIVYQEAIADAAGSFYVKAEIRSGAGRNTMGSFGYLTLTINHNCQGQRQMSVELPTSYFNQGIVALKTFDLGTINLEGRFSGEQTNGFIGGGRPFGSGFGGMGRMPII